MFDPRREWRTIYEFARRRNRQVWLTLLVVALLLAFWAVTMDAAEEPFGIPRNVLNTVTIVGILGFVGFTLFNWRCPACGAGLGRGINPTSAATAAHGCNELLS